MNDRWVRIIQQLHSGCIYEQEDYQFLVPHKHGVKWKINDIYLLRCVYVLFGSTENDGSMVPISIYSLCHYIG